MKNLRSITIFFSFLTLLVFESCSTDDIDNNGNSPGIFSVNTTETRIDGATIEWTESIDPDGDPVTYAIILEGNEIASGGTSLTYSFSGLEPDTIYQGYVESRDGNGGAARADFFFTTEPEVIIRTINLEWRDFIVDNSHIAVAYFEIPEEEDAVSYSLTVTDYSINTIPATIGRTYTWNPGDDLPTGNNVGSGASGLTEFSPGVYHANTNVSSAGAGSAGADQMLNYYAALTGTAELTIYK